MTKKKNKSSKKTFIIILVVVSAIVLGYIVQGLYFRCTGAIRTEYIFETDYDEVISIDGFVIRDEMKMKDGTNKAILTKSSNGVYSPVVSDGGSVAKNDKIAYVFDSKEQAENYEKSRELQDRIDQLKLLQNNKNLNYLDVSTLNSEIVSVVANYMNIVDSNNLSQADELIEKMNYKMTSKQIITGSDINFSKEIKSLTAQKEELEEFASSKSSVKAPFPGYFVSKADGYEEAFDYYKLEKSGITEKQIDKLMQTEPKSTENVLGKIVGQHVWYFVCNMSANDCANLKTNGTVNVDFPDKGIQSVKMTVKKIELNDDVASVIFKCSLMNGDLLGLRKEKADITINSYNGFKISNDAIVSENGQVGVYVHSGNLAVFKPIIILYSNDSYTIAVSPKERDENGEEKEIKNSLKQYDQVIVKGRNLHDQKFIG
ncbi:MAG: hypothetical protein NC122_02375 [Faecalibacterium sp.]|nr:hypothetical protein [Ruminococcus sp.]MCM1391749.1 hypothetical protein [Ruminococcus sp.]MCM1485029.1 hypothetical protein [Faecalibacterium sp.]